MREIRTSGSMSGERKRSDAVWPKPPRLSSTLLPRVHVQSWEGCVWMMKNRAGWASEHGQITKIGLSDGCGGETFTMAVEFGYGWGGFDGYLGNVG